MVECFGYGDNLLLWELTRLSDFKPKMSEVVENLVCRTVIITTYTYIMYTHYILAFD